LLETDMILILRD